MTDGPDDPARCPSCGTTNPAVAFLATVGAASRAAHDAAAELHAEAEAAYRKGRRMFRIGTLIMYTAAGLNLGALLMSLAVRASS